MPILSQQCKIRAGSRAATGFRFKAYHGLQISNKLSDNVSCS